MCRSMRLRKLVFALGEGVGGRQRRVNRFVLAEWWQEEELEIFRRRN